MRMDAV